MKTVLITGASEGIGLELAKQFACQYHLILVSHNIEKLNHAKEVILEGKHHNIDVFCVDLSIQSGALTLYNLVHEHHLNVDILVNNAGMGTLGESWNIPLEEDTDLINLNVLSCVLLTKLFLKDMVQRKDGEIIQICSTGAFQPGPFIASYYASKSYLLSYSRAIAEEVKPYGVKMYCFCIGPVKTAFYEKMHVRHTIGAVTASKIAEYVISHRNNKVVMTYGATNKIMHLIPQSLRMKMVGKMKKKLI